LVESFEKLELGGVNFPVSGFEREKCGAIDLGKFALLP